MNNELAMKVLEMALASDAPTPMKISEYTEDIGKNVFIKTVTHHYTGKLVKASGEIIVLEDASWIADDGRLNESMKDSDKFNEVEPFAKPIKLNTGSFLMMTEIEKLPRGVK